MWDFTQQRTYTFRGFYIPPRMMDDLQRYIENHIHPGNFLSTIIKNDLKQAVNYADDESLENLPAYVGFLVNHAPIGCWGNEQNFLKWLK